MRELLQIDTDVTGLINETAITYGGGVHAKHRLMRYHDFFVDRIRPGERVLDIGSGTGVLAMAALALAQSAGATLREAAVVANAAAGVVVGRVGTATATRDEVRAVLPAAIAASEVRG